MKKKIKNIIENLDIDFETIHKTEEFKSIYQKETGWLCNVENKLSLLEDISAEESIGNVILKLKSDENFDENDLLDLEVFTSKINRIISIVDWINNFKKSNELDLILLFNSIKNTSEFSELKVNVPKRLTKFLPHLFSIIKHLQDPNKYPIYYKFWKNILSNVFGKNTDYDSLCREYNSIPLASDKHMSFGAYYGAIATLIAEKIKQQYHIEFEDKDYMWLKNNLLNLESYLNLALSERRGDMKYWHMQLHPDDKKLSKEKILEILNISYIGLGEWDNGHNQITQFKNSMAINDIVLIRHKGPLALVQVAGEYEHNNNPNSDKDWFEHRRKIKVLSLYREEFNLPRKMGSAFFPTTLQVCDTFTGNITNSNYTIGDYIKQWYRFIQNEYQIDDILDFYLTIASQAISFEHCKISKEDTFYKERLLFKSLVDDFLVNLGIDNFIKFWSRQYINSVQRKAVAESILNSNGGIDGVKNKILQVTKFELQENPQDSVNDLKKIFINASYVTVEFFYTYNIKKDFFPLINNGTNNGTNILLKDTLYDKYSEVEKFTILVNKIKEIYSKIESKSDNSITYHYYLLDQLLNLVDKIKEGEQPDIKNKLVANLYSMIEKLKFKKDIEMINDNCELLKFQKQIILQGPPGTGKTRRAKFMAYYMITNRIGDDISEFKEQIKLIQFHPSYSYEDFVRGITAKSNATTTGISYDVENKVLANMANKALADKGNPYILIIDEINRANLSSVLGELIYALEYRDEPVESMYELEIKNGSEVVKSREITLPSNLYIIGTMNTADRSIGHIDYAIRRRFTFVDVLSNENNSLHEFPNGEKLYNETVKIFTEENVSPEFNIEDIKIGHSYFIAKDDDIDKLSQKFLYQVLPLLREYVKDGIFINSPKINMSTIEIDLSKKIDISIDEIKEFINR